MTLQMLQRFSDKVDERCPDFPASRQRARVLCIFHHEKNPSLSIDKEKGVFHCFSCGVGGGVKKFFELLGEGWVSAPETRQQRAQQAAVNAARNDYNQWQRQKLNELVDFKFQELQPNIEAAEIAYRAICRVPELYSPEEQSFWIARLGCLYDELAKVELGLDYLVLRECESERLEWWKEEEVKNAAAA